MRAAGAEQADRQIALWYAGGIAIAQTYWVALLASQIQPGGLFCALFILGIVVELSVPAIAESKDNTSWHRHHIIERYGLLTIIVLGETLLSAATALKSTAAGSSMVILTCSALVIVCALW